MHVYKSSKARISGSNYREVSRAAKTIFKQIKSRTKRTPYVRSKYFRGEKVFLNIFWSHLHEKHERERVRRLRFYSCAIDLIKSSTYDPITRENFKQKDEVLHRFSGKSKEGKIFTAQIKENKRTKRKDLISIFPDN